MSTNSVPGMSSSTKPSPTSNTKPNRLPAPTLFVGPPSRNASQLSVARAPTDTNPKTVRDPINRQKSALSRAYNADIRDTSGEGDAAAKASKEPPTLKKPSEKQVDAKWREMQSTLNEVELTAQSSTHVFGDSHAKALDDLRDAQVALARAWGRGNEDNATAASNDEAELNINRFKGGAEDVGSESARTQLRMRADTSASASTILSDESMLSDSSKASGRSQLEDETAQDIRLASERRAANEAYFKKVDRGVKEVVEKLEKVAEAMRGVEGESRSLWSNSDRSSTEVSAGGREEVGVGAAG